MSDLNVATQLLVYRPVLAYLLARDAHINGDPLDDLHQGFVNEISEILRRIDGGKTGQQVEALAHAELDRLFSMARNFQQLRPAPGGPAGS